MTPIVEKGYMPGNIPAVGNNAKNGFQNADEFQNIMNNLSSPKSDTFGKQDYLQNKDVKTEDTRKKQPEKTTSTDAAQKPAGSEDKDVKDVSDYTDDKTQDKVQDAEKEILTKTANKLGISEDELVDVLGQMGLTALDLLDPENVSALVAKIMGDGDMMSLITDESLSNVVLELNDIMKGIGTELAEDLNVDFRDLKSILGEMQIAGSGLSEAETAVVDEISVTDGSEDVVVAVDDREVTDQNAQDTSDDNGSAMTDDNAGAQTNESPDTYSKTSDVSERPASHQNHRVSEEGHAEVFQQAVYETPIAQDIGMEAVRELMGSGQAEIIKQISEYIKQNVTATITELEMQLNPENLGTVGLNVSTKEGAVTAQFTTQNEAVKAVMEAQIMTLKENLEQQGVKVEAVEVTVASHAFEQNLEQGNDSNEQMDQEREKLKKATRKIDLGEWASAEDIASLDEADQVTAEMMQADGNSMDYKV